jgi:hypothetical protein
VLDGAVGGLQNRRWFILVRCLEFVLRHQEAKDYLIGSIAMRHILRALTCIGSFLLLAASASVSAQELTADDYVEFWKPLVGTWKGTFEMDGITSPVTYRLAVAPNKKCILIDMDIDGVPGVQRERAPEPEGDGAG